jgi:heavy metal sensor kinase
MSRFRTLRVRFAMWTAGLLLAVLAIFGALVYASMARGLAASLDDSLVLDASQAIAGIDIEEGALDFPEQFVETPRNADVHRQGFTIRVFNWQGQVLREFGPYSDLPLTPDSLAAARQQQTGFATLTDPASRDQVRVYTAPIVKSDQVGGIIQIAVSLETVQDTLSQLLTTLLAGVPLAVLTAGLSGYLLAARALAPIDHITRTARRISAEDLSARLDLPATDDEVGRLAATFDAMLARLDESFRRERRFVADASHELRTPLAAMQAIFGVIREKRRSPQEYEQALADLAEETDRLRLLTEDLLRLARGDGHQPMARERVDLSTLLCDVADSLRPLAEAKGLALTCTVPAGLALTADGDGLIRLFANLLDNAIKYTEQGSVTVSADRGQDGVLNVAVTDTGRGIPAEHLPHVFERFYRADPARTSDGAGLGLTIALEIARAHAGSIELTSEAGRGTTATVQLRTAC